MKSALAKAIAVAALVSAASLSFAGPFYGSASIGRSEMDLGVSGVDDADTSFSIAGGWQFHENFAVEVGYIDFGEVGARDGASSFKLGADALELSLIGTLPLNNTFGLMGRLGIDSWDADLRYTDDDPDFGSGKASVDGSDLFYGIGAYAKFSEAFRLQAEYQFHELDDVDVDVLSIGASFFF